MTPEQETQMTETIEKMVDQIGKIIETLKLTNEIEQELGKRQNKIGKALGELGKFIDLQDKVLSFILPEYKVTMDPLEEEHASTGSDTGEDSGTGEAGPAAPTTPQDSPGTD